MEKLFIAVTVALALSCAGCDNHEQQQKLQEAQANFQKTVDNQQAEYADKIQDAQMQRQQIEHGERAACVWLRKQHFKYVGPKTRSWQEACDALYPHR
jgi:hypothetical protein